MHSLTSPSSSPTPPSLSAVVVMVVGVVVVMVVVGEETKERKCINNYEKKCIKVVSRTHTHTRIHTHTHTHTYNTHTQHTIQNLITYTGCCLLPLILGLDPATLGSVCMWREQRTHTHAPSIPGVRIFVRGTIPSLRNKLERKGRREEECVCRIMVYNLGQELNLVGNGSVRAALVRPMAWCGCVVVEVRLS